MITLVDVFLFLSKGLSCGSYHFMDVRYFNQLAMIIEFFLTFYIGVIIGLVVVACIISILENERRAAYRFIFLAFVAVLPYVLLDVLSCKGRLVFAFFAEIFPPFILFLLLRRKESTTNYFISETEWIPGFRFDERDIMFSREDLLCGSGRYEDYYRRNPDKKKMDDQWRKLPGLMHPDSLFYDPEVFASAEASFQAVTQLHPLVEGVTAPEKIQRTPDEWTDYLVQWAEKLGAVNAGVTRLRDYHLYSHVGRGDSYGQKVVLDHPFAFVLTVEMDKKTMDNAPHAPHAPVVRESAQKYLKSAVIAVQIALFIRAMGYQARAHIDGNYRLICPLVARDAGLGEIGRMGLLMTPRLGPRVRIAVVTTDIPLVPAKYEPDQSVLDFCTHCKKCAIACPSQAISDKDRISTNNVLRWKLNAELCFEYWCRVGTDCGRCMKVCPYSHPDNCMHNFVRWGIKRNDLFRRIAIIMDDLIYGKIPKSTSTK